MCNHQINAFCCQQRRMEHKGGHWLVHEECIVRMWYAKRHILGWNNVEQWKIQPHSVSLYWVMLVWRRQSVNQLVSRKFHYLFFKFYSNFWVNANQYCPGKTEGGFDSWATPTPFVIPTMNHSSGSCMISILQSPVKWKTVPWRTCE